jgi:uncharacterized membrane protein HdeD (DUF308 family)
METASAPAPVVGKKALNWSIAISILMIVAGLLAIVVPAAAGIAVTFFVGWLLLFSGFAHFAYSWHLHATGAILWEILIGLLYIAVGGYMLFHPLLGMASLTLALAAYLFAECVLEFVIAFHHRGRPRSVWLVFDGVITFILAVMILFTWPSSTGWVLGTLVGISMLFSGITRVMISHAARKAVHQAA